MEFNQGNKKKSLIKLKKFIKINPNDINAKLDLAYMYINLNLIKRAIIQYRIILKKEKNIKAMFNLAVCFANQKKFNDCEFFLKKIIKKDKNHFRSYVALGDIYFKMGNLNKATKFLKIAEKLKSNDLVIFNIMGVIEMKKHNIVAVLWPTNTGKTFYAIETMLSFDSGMIGFPLRLLAREVYDKIIKKIDPKKVALITGEEKIIPLSAKYYLCTVESMPIDKY